jgi:hypothetical protein
MATPGDSDLSQPRRQSVATWKLDPRPRAARRTGHRGVKRLSSVQGGSGIWLRLDGRSREGSELTTFCLDVRTGPKEPVRNTGSTKKKSRTIGCPTCQPGERSRIFWQDTKHPGEQTNTPGQGVGPSFHGYFEDSEEDKGIWLVQRALREATLGGS